MKLKLLVLNIQYKMFLKSGLFSKTCIKYIHNLNAGLRGTAAMRITLVKIDELFQQKGTSLSVSSGMIHTLKTITFGGREVATLSQTLSHQKPLFYISHKRKKMNPFGNAQRFPQGFGLRSAIFPNRPRSEKLSPLLVYRSITMNQH